MNLLKWLNATNFADIPKLTINAKASQVTFELLYSEECLEQINNEECFSVQVLFNNMALEFVDDCQDAALCTYLEFITYVEVKIAYKGPYADNLKQACEVR